MQQCTLSAGMARSNATASRGLDPFLDFDALPSAIASNDAQCTAPLIKSVD
jgi:hypothetical protein